jgi:hypothetical protein
MKLDITDLTEHSICTLEKAHKGVKSRLKSQLGLIFDVVVLDNQDETSLEIQNTIDNMLNDEFNKHVGSYLITMDKVRRLIENGLN